MSIHSSNSFAKKQNILKQVEVCLDLVNKFSKRLQQNRQKMVELKSLKVESQPDLSSRTDVNDTSFIRSNHSLMNLYRLNFPITQGDGAFLLKQLVYRLAAKKLALGAVIDLHGQLFQSQIVQLMLRKLSFDNAYRLRKTVRYFFQITPFDNERTRDRIELIDSVEEKLQELHLQIDLKVEEEGRKVFTKEEQAKLVRMLAAEAVQYEAYPMKQGISILENVLGFDLATQILVGAVEDKRSLTKINPYELIGIPPNMMPSYSKKESAKTATSESFIAMDQEYLLEDCEIECVPYETVFGTLG